MLRHILFWDFTEEVKKGDTDAALRKLSDSVDNLNGKIEGLLHAEIGKNTADGCDFVFYAEFTNEKALQTFMTHPLHVAHKEMAKKMVCNRRAADYIVKK